MEKQINCSSIDLDYKIENQTDYSSIDLDYNCDTYGDVLIDNFESISQKVDTDILNSNKTSSTLENEKSGLKPIREIIRGSVIYEQDGNNN